MKASRIPVLFHSFSLLCFLWLKPCFGLSLKEAFSEHFLVGTIWHGYSVDGEKNKFLAQEKALTATEFNVITPENCMKPSFTQPKEGIFTFAEGDDLVAFAQEHSIAVVGHTLVWKNDAPQWFFKDAAGGEVSREVLIERMKEHIRTVVGRYRGRIAYWDVVNETTHDALLTQATWELLWLILHHPEYGNQLSEIIDYEWININSTTGKILSRLLAELREGMIDSVNQIENIIDSVQERQLLADIHSRELSVEEPTKQIVFCLERLRRNFVETKIKNLEQKIINSDPESQIRLMRERKEILRKVAQPLELAL